MNQNRQLPRSLYRFFWDVDAEKIDVEKHVRYVVARLLEYGNTEAIRWVLKNFDEGVIVDALKNSRTISAKTAIYWSLIYDIPREEILCLNKSYQPQRGFSWLS